MATVDIGARDIPAVPTDDLDDLYDPDLGDIFRDTDTNIRVLQRDNALMKAAEEENEAGLGIDEEIKVTKRRTPIPKLDNDRLLSPSGIPKLRRIAKERFRFKGKGHEYSDVARLLNVYQLWLDELYPRAKFADALTIIEKLGHSKRTQTMRKEWIREGGQRNHVGSKEEAEKGYREFRLGQAPQRYGSGIEQQDGEVGQSINLTGEELYEATPPPTKEQDDRRYDAVARKNLFISDIEEKSGDQPPEDDLDALLAEHEAMEATTLDRPTGLSRRESKNEGFDDEMDAMRVLDGI